MFKWSIVVAALLAAWCDTATASDCASVKRMLNNYADQDQQRGSAWDNVKTPQDNCALSRKEIPFDQRHLSDLNASQGECPEFASQLTYVANEVRKELDSAIASRNKFCRK